MLNAIWTRIFGLSCGICRMTYRAVPWTTFFCGIGAGGILLALVQHFLSQLGCSSPVIAAAWSMAGLGWAIAWGSSTLRGPQEITPFQANSLSWRNFIEPGLLLVLVAAGPWIWNIHEYALSESSLVSPGFLFCYASAWAMLMLAIPVWCVSRLALLPQHSEVQSGSKSSTVIGAAEVPSSCFLLGTAAGILICPVLSFGNLYLTSVLASLVVLGTRFAILRSRISSGAAKELDSKPVAVKGVAKELAGGRSSTILGACQYLSVACACGGLLVWQSNVIGLVLVPTIYVFTAIATGTLTGMALGIVLESRNQVSQRRRLLWGSISLIASSLSFTAGFSFVVYRLITLAGSISDVWLLQGLRDLLIAALTIPVGYVWSLSSFNKSTGASTDSQTNFPATRTTWSFVTLPGTGVASALVGGLLIQAVLIPTLGLSATAYLLMFWIAGITLVDVLRHAELPHGVVQRGLLTACGIASIFAPLFSDGIRPELASRLLFSTNVYIAER
ncbi:MAG: hypothetical protein JWM11_6810, partial [Planctomycetaceae bacterium]|nr:hypothetical protein [Planctomycetaceae bacterium]